MRIWSVLALVAQIALGQTGPKFEVASVRETQPGKTMLYGVPLGATRGGPGSDSPGTIYYNGVTLFQLITRAYDVRRERVFAPDWMKEKRFDVNAKVPDGSTPDDLKWMVRELLRERFGFTGHTETREFDTYALVPHSSGMKLTPVSGAPGFGYLNRFDGGARFTLMRAPLSELAALLELVLGGMVVDQTGWDGKIDAVVEFADLAPTTQPSGLPELDTVLSEQFGLKLERRKSMLDALVVDRVNRVPTEN